VLYVHCAAPALSPHIEWAAAGVLGMPVRMHWQPQPVSPGAVRTELAWTGQPGASARLASALIGWPIRFEVTEDAGPGYDGERYAFTPSLGLFHAATSANGDIVVPESRLRHLLAGQLGDGYPVQAAARPSGEELANELDRLLGGPWDAELETFRHAGEGAPVRWLHQVV
jgi:hypothetical protein